MHARVDANNAEKNDRCGAGSQLRNKKKTAMLLVLHIIIKVKISMFTEKKRVQQLLIVSTLMNTVLFLCAYYLKLPVWLDTTGTIYASVILGSPAGFILAIINNVFESVFFFGKKSLLFYFVSLVSALIAGRVMKGRDKGKIKSWLLMLFFEMVFSTFAAVLITFITGSGNTNNYWSNVIIQEFKVIHVPDTISIILGVSIIKAIDVFVTVIMVLFFYRFTSVRLKTDTIAIQRWEKHNEN